MESQSFNTVHVFACASIELFLQQLNRCTHHGHYPQANTLICPGLPHGIGCSHCSLPRTKLIFFISCLPTSQTSFNNRIRKNADSFTVLMPMACCRVLWNWVSTTNKNESNLDCTCPINSGTMQCRSGDSCHGELPTLFCTHYVAPSSCLLDDLPFLQPL